MKKPITTRSPKTVNKAGAKTTTKTADGGQLYVRGGVNSKGSYKVAGKARDSYMGDPVGRGTKNPKIARNLTEATYMSMAPKNKDQTVFAKKMGALSASHADESNKLVRARGDRKKR